jgi:hypothetical protein
MTRTRDRYWRSSAPEQVVGSLPGREPSPGDDDPTRRRAAVGALVVTALAVIGALLLPSAGERTADPDVEPSIPPAPDAPTPSIERPEPILGAGWDEIDAGLVAGRIGPAAAWVESGLFVWGGYVPGPTTPVPGHTWRHEGALFDPATGSWWPVAALPDGVCPPRGPAVAYPAGDIVVLRLRTHWRVDCATAAVYHPDTDSWEPLRSEFFRRVTWIKPLAWTGELFVAPRDGLAHHWESGETFTLPPFPRGWEDSARVSHAQWAGDRVFAVGSSGTFSWRPGDEAWERVGPPVSTDTGSAAVWSDHGLVVAEYRIGAERYDDGSWRASDLPLVSSRCPASAVAVGGVAVVRMCSGMALWDGVRDAWVPIPLDDVASWDPFGMVVVGGDDAVYTVGRYVRRFPIERAGDGSIVPPDTLPVGSMLLDVPPGFSLVSSFGSVRGPLPRTSAVAPQRSIPDEQTVGVRLAAPHGASCTVASTITAAGFGTTARLAGATEVGPAAVLRPGRPTLEGTEIHYDDGSRAATFLVGSAGPLLAHLGDEAGEAVTVRCAGPIAPLAVRVLAEGLWSPWE